MPGFITPEPGQRGWAIAVTAAAITPRTPRSEMAHPGVSVDDGRGGIFAWKDTPTGWEIAREDGLLDPVKADELLAGMGWRLEPGSQWRESAPGLYIASVELAGGN